MLQAIANSRQELKDNDPKITKKICNIYTPRGSGKYQQFQTDVDNLATSHVGLSLNQHAIEVEGILNDLLKDLGTLHVFGSHAMGLATHKSDLVVPYFRVSMISYPVTGSPFYIKRRSRLNTESPGDLLKRLL